MTPSEKQHATALGMKSQPEPSELFTTLWCYYYQPNPEGRPIRCDGFASRNEALDHAATRDCRITELDSYTLPGNTTDPVTLETRTTGAQSSAGVAKCVTDATTRQKLWSEIHRLGWRLSEPDFDRLCLIGFVHREDEIIAWGEARNIIGDNRQAVPSTQCTKTLEEVRELGLAIATGDTDGVRDAIGDTFVTLVMQAQMWGFTMAECIEAAWQQIKDRRGVMRDGVFVKEVR